MDCQTFLQGFLDKEPRLSSIYVTMVTLNVDFVASYAETRLYYIPGEAIVQGPVFPGRWMSLDAGSAGIDQPKFNFGLAIQVFSDRLTADPLLGLGIGLPHVGRQKFDEERADSLRLIMTDTDPVHITVALRSWNDAEDKFIPVYEPDGFMFGSTASVKYILRVQKWPPPDFGD